MARKKKDDKNKVVRYNFSLLPSMCEWLEVQNKKSTYIQRLIAQDVLGLTFEEFVDKLYSDEYSRDNRNHNQDTMEQEYIRAAKWMLDGKIDQILRVTSEYIYANVTWRISGINTIIGIKRNSKGFESVIYDFTVLDYPDDYDYGTLDTDGIKEYMIVRWLTVSKKLDDGVEII